MDVCVEHQVEITDITGKRLWADFGFSEVHWGRTRDDVSTARVVIPTALCCDWIGDVRAVEHHLQIYLNERYEWLGVITRIEFEVDTVTLYAEDFLWVAKRKVLEVGYKNLYQTNKTRSAIWRMWWLLKKQCYDKFGDPYNMGESIIQVSGTNDPKSARSVKAYSTTILEDLDKYAEDGGADYTTWLDVVFLWDTQLNWWDLEPLTQDDFVDPPAVVEYGNELSTRTYYTNGKGYAAQFTAPKRFRDRYGYVERLITSWNEDEESKDKPTAEVRDAWHSIAKKDVQHRTPLPRRVRSGANATLRESAPWQTIEIMPGAMFYLSTTNLCRNVTTLMKLDSVRISEEAGQPIKREITAGRAPREVIDAPVFPTRAREQLTHTGQTVQQVAEDAIKRQGRRQP